MANKQLIDPEKESLSDTQNGEKDFFSPFPVRAFVLLYLLFIALIYAFCH